jgi:hypothetical protein
MPTRRSNTPSGSKRQTSGRAAVRIEVVIANKYMRF